MIFKRSIQRYGRTPLPETPFQRAGQLWDERIGSARVQARNWRYMAFGGLLLSSAISTALIWQSLQSRVTPYVVEVDRLGQARAVSPAEADYTPTDPQIAWHLAEFIRNVRTVSLDPVLMRRDWLSAYDFVTQRGAQFLGDYARSAAPFDQIGERTVSVQVTSVVRASDQSFQVKWIETAFERGAKGRNDAVDGHSGRDDTRPRSADALRRNPLGIYIDAIDWSRELEPPEPASPLLTEPVARPADPSIDAQAPADPERSPASPSSQENFQ